MDPVLSRLGGRIVHTKVFMSLSFDKRQEFIKDVENASKFDDLTPENREYWHLAEGEIRENYEKTKSKKYARLGPNPKTTAIYE